MSGQHTPGPWAVSGVRMTSAPAIGRDTRLLGVGPDGDGLALVFFDMKTARGQADARLIAAAPDLLEACKVAAKAELYDPHTGLIDADVLEIVQDVARAAIAKATGAAS